MLVCWGGGGGTEHTSYTHSYTHSHKTHNTGRCAIKIESAADQCVETLSELIQTKVNYVVQEAIVVIRVCVCVCVCVFCVRTTRPCLALSLPLFSSCLSLSFVLFCVCVCVYL